MHDLYNVIYVPNLQTVFLSCYLLKPITLHDLKRKEQKGKEAPHLVNSFVMNYKWSTCNATGKATEPAERQRERVVVQCESFFSSFSFIQQLIWKQIDI